MRFLDGKTLSIKLFLFMYNPFNEFVQKIMLFYCHCEIVSDLFSIPELAYPIFLFYYLFHVPLHLPNFCFVQRMLQKQTHFPITFLRTGTFRFQMQ